MYSVSQVSFIHFLSLILLECGAAGGEGSRKCIHFYFAFRGTLISARRVAYTVAFNALGFASSRVLLPRGYVTIHLQFYILHLRLRGPKRFQ